MVWYYCVTGYSFTATEIARALQRPKRSVLESLKGISPSETKIVHGNQAKAWSKQALPAKILAALNNAATRQKTNVDTLVASSPPFWRPRYPLSQFGEEAISRASLLQRALAPTLARLNDLELTTAEFEQLGVEDYRRVFGHSISTRHWRRSLKRTLVRDGGAENWSRLEIYLNESLSRRPELKRIVPFRQAAFRPLQELISSFESPVKPTNLEKSCLWIYAFEHFERESERSGKPKAVKRETLKFLYESASFLGRSPKGIKVQFDRKLKRWIAGGRIPAAIADKRKQNPGRPAPKLAENEEHALIATALRCGGGMAQAWRESRDSGVFNNRISQHYTSTPASKSYVPRRIRKLLVNKMRIAFS